MGPCPPGLNFRCHQIEPFLTLNSLAPLFRAKHIKVVDSGTVPGIVDPDDQFYIMGNQRGVKIRREKMTYKNIITKIWTDANEKKKTYKDKNSFLLEVALYFSLPASMAYHKMIREIEGKTQEDRCREMKVVAIQIQGACDLAKSLLGDPPPKDFTQACAFQGFMPILCPPPKR